MSQIMGARCMQPGLLGQRFFKENSKWKTVSIKHGLRTRDCGLGIKDGLGIKRGLQTADWV